MKPTRQFLVAFITVALAVVARPSRAAEPAATPSSWRVEIHADTMDRTVVPLITDSKTTQVNATTERTETTTRTLQANGGYAVAERSTSVTDKANPNLTKTTTQVVAVDHQGIARTTKAITETDTKTASGTVRQIVTEKRNHSGQLVPDRTVTETSVRNPDGTVSTRRADQMADVNGNLLPERRVQETTRAVGPNEAVTTSLISTMDHGQGRFAATAQEVTTVRTSPDSTRSERLISIPHGVGWDLRAKIVTDETRATDGSVQRETIRYSRPAFAGSDSTQSLEPKLKIEERLVTQPDGTSVLKREVFFRDVNGGWKPQTFSAATPSPADLGR